MKQKILSIALLAMFFLFSACSENPPIVPDIPKPTPEVPKPEKPNSEFHNIKFNGNGIVLEIETENSLAEITCPFKLKGNDMFFDKNLNGIKDSDEKLSNNVTVNLSLPTKNGKALYVIRGNIDFFELLESSGNGNKPLTKIKNSKADVSKCSTLEELYIKNAKLSYIKIGKLKELKNVYLGKNKLESLDLEGLDKIEEIYANNNEKLSGKFNFSEYSNLISINFANTSISGITLPKSKSCKSLELENTKVESIDLSNGENMTLFSYGSSVTKELDITPLNKIAELYLEGSTELVKLIDKSSEKKVELGTVVISNTPKLKEYDLSKYEALSDVYAKTGIDINSLIDRLPNRKDKIKGNLHLTKENADKFKDNQKLKDKKWWIEEIKPTE